MAQPIALSKRVHRATEIDKSMSGFSTEEIVREVLRRLGEDPSRDGLMATPERVEKSMAFLTKGYDENAAEILRGALFDEDYDEMVIVKDIEIFSLCEHHAALLRQSACGLCAKRQGNRTEQNTAIS